MGGIMREREGIESPGPGRSQKTPWSKGRETYIRNVEAVGSNPITSTEGPGQGLGSGIRDVTLRDLIGEQSPEDRYVVCRRNLK